MKYKQLYVSPLAEITVLRLTGDCLQQEKIQLSNAKKVTEPGGEINAGEGLFDEEEFTIPQQSNLWEE